MPNHENETLPGWTSGERALLESSTTERRLQLSMPLSAAAALPKLLGPALRGAQCETVPGRHREDSLGRSSLPGQIIII